ncbi:MAG: alcohol dehydrogenase catalytic domain-containing protein, partial [Rhodothermales bacterium]|nr:alcohol dehydrogenase catalytic domain-containing protein [Rhodothermales bacterium]
MRAALFDQFGGEIRVECVADPEPRPDDIVVQVKANGICRSDWHGWMGHDRSIRLPHVPGHEFCGVVVNVGSR